MVMDGSSVISQQQSGGQMQPQQGGQQQQQGDSPNASRVAHEFVRQYYTVLHESPVHLHRFYNEESDFEHGSMDTVSTSKPVRGQQEIHRTIVSLNFRDCHSKIRYVDAQESVNKSVVVQVAGELSNNGSPMRRFMQTFLLVPLSARKYYVRNDIFRYQDELFDEPEEDDIANANEQQSGQVMNGAAGDHHASNGGHADLKDLTDTSTSALEESNQWDNSMANQTPPATQPTPTSSQQPTPVQPQKTPQQTEVSSPAAAPVVTQAPAPAAPAAPRSWSQMVQVKPAATPSTVTHPTAQRPAFGPPVTTSSAKMFGGASPAAGGTGGTLPQRMRGGASNGPRNNGTNPNASSSGDKPRRGEGHEGGNHSRPFIPDNQQLFVGNIPTSVTDETIKYIFSRYGKVNDFHFAPPKNTSNSGSGSSKSASLNFGFLVFDSPDSVEKVLAEGKNATWQTEDGTQLSLNVEEKRSRPAGGRGPRGGGAGGPPRGDRRPPMANGGPRRDFSRQDNNGGGRPQRTGPPRQQTGGAQH